ncbi:MAG: gliding motility-associated C-terminal domain-containing protein [Bacteroidales bacterium]
MMRLLMVVALMAFLLAGTIPARATHNRAGEITYKQLSELTYRVTVITYTSTGPEPVADRPRLEVQFGDGSSAEVPRIEETFLPDYYKRNRYVWDHTYPGPGTYQIVVEDPNRNRGVKNIPNSVNVVFSIKTILVISPNVGQNSTPVLLNPPIDKAALGYTFIHNPAAFDPDGDSLSYKLAICTAEGGREIEGYTFPPFSDSLVVDERTGDLIWSAPTEVGKYNVAMTIEEWRDGIRIGRIQRDMQIEVYISNNKPPEISGVGKHCILAGEEFSTEIRATDPNGDSIQLTATGGPLTFENNSAVFHQVLSTPGLAIATLKWKTDCSMVRKQPYLMIIKAKDNNRDLSLIDSKNIEVTVIAPRPENLTATPTSSHITLSWDPSVCANAAGYRVYRRINPVSFNPGECQTGVPPELGYQLVGTVNGHLTTQFIDNNKGHGLEQATDYCYRVIAWFADGAESFASEEACARLVRGLPLITQVSVEETSTVTGKMRISWRVPNEEELAGATGPYRYLLFRSPGMFGMEPLLVDSLQGLESTTYLDQGINTQSVQWSYIVELWNVETANRHRIGTPQLASSLFVNLSPMNKALKINYTKNVPWTNEHYTILRQNDPGEDSVGQTTELSYIDRGLQEGISYCYRVRSFGGFPDLGVSGLINYSQINCAVPVDTVAPCPPILVARSVCDSLANRLTWNNVNDSCAEDAAFYRIYYRNTIDGEMARIDSVGPATKTAYWHYPVNTMAGCYAITAVDSVGNESQYSNIICLDECINYSLPNVFTPNGDGINDYLRPNPYNRVEKIDLKVFSRWNTLVFQTEDPAINWDGKHFRTGKLVPAGVYYYICDVYEHRLTGLEPRYITGFIHVFHNEAGRVGR